MLNGFGSHLQSLAVSEGLQVLIVKDVSYCHLFSRAHAGDITPILVYRCDESSLVSLSSLLPSSSIPSLLSLSLPSCMALILPNFAQRDSRDCEAGSEDRRKKAQTSHGLLTKHLSEEVHVRM